VATIGECPHGFGDFQCVIDRAFLHVGQASYRKDFDKVARRKGISDRIWDSLSGGTEHRVLDAFWRLRGGAFVVHDDTDPRPALINIFDQFTMWIAFFNLRPKAVYSTNVFRKIMFACLKGNQSPRLHERQKRIEILFHSLIGMISIYEKKIKCSSSKKFSHPLAAARKM